MNWKHKDEWKQIGRDFQVVVSRHSVMSSEPSSNCYDAEGEHRWCLYAYIYPAHPHYAKFEGSNLWQDAAAIGMHGGCSFLRRHYGDDGKVTSIQVGADYHHDGDWQYTQMATQDDARGVFNDAQELFDKLAAMEKQGAAS